ncbi:DUF4129 domain-containing protein [Microlunatus sp. GCM10028923]|uniref:DUF4129 domain-containing protein n=1 Tax=Microlunatus sp. GCM10028923 TaxID=3273400 RepID=UPI003609A4E0
MRRKSGSAGAVLVLAGVVGLMALIAAGVGGPWTVVDRWGLIFGTPAPMSRPPQPISNPFASATPPPSERQPPPDLSWLNNVLLTLAILAGVAALGFVAWLIWRRFRAMRPDLEDEPVPIGAGLAQVQAEPELPVLRRGAAAAARLLDRIADPNDAIIRAWLALEEAAEASGVPREQSETPTEFTVDVLDRTPAPPEPVQRLLRLYLAARFGSAPATAEDVRHAKQALFALAEHWSAADVAVDRISRGGSPGSPSAPADESRESDR